MSGKAVAEITVPYRIRFDECGPDGIVRTSALLRYAQDVAWVHSERLGFDRAWYRGRDLAWVVRCAELAVLRPMPLGTVLDVTTRVIGFRKVWARRRTEARLADGALSMWGHTDWVMTDGRGRPTRVPAEFPGRFDAPPGSFEPGRVPLPSTPAGAQAHHGVVRPQDLDPMGHVNNAAYLDYLEEALLGVEGAGAGLIDAVPRRLRIEYLAPAAPGAELTGAAWSQAVGDRRRWAWRLSDVSRLELARGQLVGDQGRIPDRQEVA